MSDSTSFRSVLRGYDPAQVDQWRAEHAGALEQARQEAAERTVEVSELRAALARTQEEQAGTARSLASLKDEHSKAAAPTYANLGERIGTILGLADEEAAEIRSNAQADADTLRGTTSLEADRVRTEADRYAEDVRTKADADATQVVEKAKQQADAILDDADREASARREEAEAFYEHQRARAASAAADFEATLGQRRDKSAAEFSAQMAAHENALTQAQERAATLSADSERAHAEAHSESQRAIEAAKAEAEQLVTAAREQAERIRRDSERELSAATQRRDSITAQLSNVRQMLATLGGAAMVDSLDSPVAAPQGDQPAATSVEDGAPTATGAGTDEDGQPSDAETGEEAEPDEDVEADATDGDELAGATAKQEHARSRA
jgi:cell division septum initiation protein DivIVA